VIDSAGSRCRNLCRLHLRIINTCAIAESRSARMAERSANSSADIVCTLLHRRSRLCFRFFLLPVYRSVSPSRAPHFFLIDPIDFVCISNVSINCREAKEALGKIVGLVQTRMRAFEIALKGQKGRTCEFLPSSMAASRVAGSPSIIIDMLWYTAMLKNQRSNERLARRIVDRRLSIAGA